MMKATAYKASKEKAQSQIKSEDLGFGVCARMDEHPDLRGKPNTYGLFPIVSFVTVNGAPVRTPQGGVDVFPAYHTAIFYAQELARSRS
tara:strand:- start:593 stop:859 length:267 start_codon:yes stop_codon:yes gene_type:complete